MTSEVQGVIADWLHARKVVDADGFGMRAAKKVSQLVPWSQKGIATELQRVRTDLFRRNNSTSKEDLCNQLASVLFDRFKNDAANLIGIPDRCGIAFFAANPIGTSQLALDEEIRSVSKTIRASKYRDTIDLVLAMAARPDDLLQYLNEHDVQVVHFSGHGGGAIGLSFQDDLGQPAMVTADALRALFGALKGKIRLVVLNACHSQSQATAIAEEIDCVVAMNDSIGDAAARVFAASVYRAIGFGKSVQNAFDQGIAALLLEGIGQNDVPVLICKKGVKADSVRLIKC